MSSEFYSKKCYWTDEEFIKIVNQSTSISEVLKYFNLPEQQPHYRKRFYFDIQRLNINISHMGDYVLTQSKILNDGKAIPSTFKLKQKLLKTGVEYKCSNSFCNITDIWLNNIISLHLDHIDGNRTNNNLENLRFLCPNCHSQTSTYTNKNIKNKYNPPKNPNKLCIICGKYRKGARSKGNCKKCKPLKIIWPDIKDVLKRLENESYTKIAKDLNVSDNAVRKFLRRNQHNS